MIVTLNKPSQPRIGTRRLPAAPGRATPATTQHAARRHYKKPGFRCTVGNGAGSGVIAQLVRKFRRTCSGCFGVVWWRGPSVSDGLTRTSTPDETRPTGKPVSTGSAPSTHRCYVGKKSQPNASGGWKTENRRLCEVIALALATAERTTSWGASETPMKKSQAIIGPAGTTSSTPSATHHRRPAQ